MRRPILILCLMVGLVGNSLAAPASRRIPNKPKSAPQTLNFRSEVLVRIKDRATMPHVLDANFVGRQELPGLPGWVRVPANDFRAKLKRLQADTRVRDAFLVPEGGLVRDSVDLNDAYLSQQWTLGTPGLESLPNLYADGVTGAGVRIGIVDDGVESNHPDLAPNFNSPPPISRNFGLTTTNNDVNRYTPYYSNDIHGTAVTGLAAARGGNGIGMTGLAPEANWGALRLDFNIASVLTDDVNATGYLSTGPNPSYQLQNHSYGPSTAYYPDPAQAAILADSAAAGVIHVRSAGNGRSGYSDVTKFYERGTPDSIVVGAVASDGKWAEYSCYGASLTCVAPSASSRTNQNVFTTDRQGKGLGWNGSSDPFPNPDYTTLFGGTSAAAPEITGLLALVKAFNPNASTRLIKHLLARSCRTTGEKVIGPTDDGGWTPNAAGFRFDPNYGFGLIDAAKLMQFAAIDTGVTPLATETTALLSPALPIPDNDPTGVTTTFSIATNAPMEEVQVALDITHTFRGDLDADLTSPSGTKRKLFWNSDGDSDANIHWTYMSNAYWGENPQGTWKLTIHDNGAGDTGTLNTVQATVRTGTVTSVGPINSATVLLGDFSGLSDGHRLDFQLVSNGVVVETRTGFLVGNSAKVAFASTGTFDVYVKASNWLRRKIGTFVIGASPVTFPSVSLDNGDIDGNNVVDISDYAELSRRFNRPRYATGYANHADLDGNGVVNINDYAILCDHFGLVGD